MCSRDLDFLLKIVCTSYLMIFNIFENSLTKLVFVYSLVKTVTETGAF